MMVDTETFGHMMEEFKELTIRMANLTNFINSDTYKQLGDTERSLLVAQYGAMMSYSKVLEIRIALERAKLEESGVKIDELLKTDAEKVVESAKKKTTKKSTTAKKKTTKKVEEKPTEEKSE